jgi:hypothetical protein
LADADPIKEAKDDEDEEGDGEGKKKKVKKETKEGKPA